MVGRKLLMSISGALMVLFALAHMAGNATIFAGGMNEYAARLSAAGPALWLARIVMASALIVHVYIGVALSIRDDVFGPSAYVRREYIRAGLASRSMIWSGLVIAAFLSYHLLQFTFHASITGTMAPGADIGGRKDVMGMVVSGLSRSWVSAFYAFALSALALHMMHGIQSMLQTVGLMFERIAGFARGACVAIAVIVFLIYISIPLAVLAGALGR